MAANNAAAYQQAVDDACRILLLVHQVILNPTQASIDAIVAAYSGSNSGSQALIPKPDYNSGGVSFQWSAYRDSLVKFIDGANDIIVKLTGPYQFTVHGR